VWHATGAGILLHANGMRMLRSLGVGEAVEQAGAVVQRWGFCDQQGEVLCWPVPPLCHTGSAPRSHR
jgi:2-polyprenyl-6-methoxyphenol hydroxylase-like FAD-dependent oxidoreductase